jgi:purine-binding chemotaxis protein CheW
MKEKKLRSEGKQSEAVDWKEVYRRLEITRTTLERGSITTQQERKKVLKARAIALAREPDKKEPAVGKHLEIVEFLLANERYGIESSFVREVNPIKTFTPLPGTPRFILGIINVRGKVMSVVDIKKFFDLPEKTLTELNKVIILHHEEMEFGLLADVILGVSQIPLSVIQPSLPTLTGIREEYLKGVTRERLIILDAEKLLKDKKILIREEIEL